MTEVERALYFLAALLAAFVVAFLVGRAVGPIGGTGPAPDQHDHQAAARIEVVG
jgi:hypothetical protein